ncbi:MAG TPA: TolC family protein, partial [Rhodanobacter sp.]|nr:TolC family protein [Rhodanobacter sp.]
RLGLDAVRLQQTALDAARRSYAHAQARYAAGDIALSELLAEERVLRDAEDGYARTHTAAAIDLVALYKALGGGWDSAADARGQGAAGPQHAGPSHG